MRITKVGFQLPTFNLPINIWHLPNLPPLAPDLVTVGNLAIGRRISWNGVTSPAVAPWDRVWLLLPAGTDVRDALNTGSTGDRIEIGAGTRRFYQAEWVEDSGGGFSNEHRVCLCRKIGDWPLPYPRPLGGPPFTFPAIVGSGVSSDGGRTVTITFYAPPGLCVAFVGQAPLTASTMRVTVAGYGVPSQDVSETAVGAVFGHMSLNGYSWPHPGGTGSVTFATSNPSTILAFVAAMGGNTFDGSGQMVVTANPMTVSTSSPTTLNPDTAAAAFVYDGGALPESWTPPFLSTPGSPLIQTFSTLGPLMMSFGLAGPLLPGVQTAVDTLTAPSTGQYAGGIIAIGP